MLAAKQVNIALERWLFYTSRHKIIFHAGVAQLVEQLIRNQ